MKKPIVLWSVLATVIILAILYYLMQINVDPAKLNAEVSLLQARKEYYATLPDVLTSYGVLAITIAGSVGVLLVSFAICYTILSLATKIFLSQGVVMRREGDKGGYQLILSHASREAITPKELPMPSVAPVGRARGNGKPVRIVDPVKVAEE